MNFDRRTYLKGIGAGLGLLGVAGVTSADDRERYLVVGGNGGVEDRLEETAFDVDRSLADGTVSLVWGPADAADDLEAIEGVQRAAHDYRLELAGAELERGRSEAESAVDEPAFYEELLWDKQLIESVEANARATGDGATVAVIDTGIDSAHPELAPNLDEDAGRLFREGTVESGVDEVLVPDDYADPTSLDTATFHVADDQEGHGTHVAGIAAAADGDDVIGTAPDATLVSLRVFWWTTDDEGEPTLATTTGDVLTAIDHAAERGYDAANLSLGTAPIEPREMSDDTVRTMRNAYQRVVQRATQRGTVVVASAGNDETRLQQGGLFSLPNSVQGAMSVSATAPNDELAFYSDYGTNEIDVGAPGGGYETLEKTVDPGADVDWPYPTNLVFSVTSPRIEGDAYGWKAGTSMAAPQVAGLVALVRELDPEATPNQIESAIKHGAAGDPGRSDPEVGAGRINARETVERL
ncbi:S8 family peptidase [Halosolutus gelatinilyticus]|uniref:S8 family peptidase n=1 Tax=Halosolutus gelatinilyticus TaxID=2931975 RepID=UPI001FF492D5|nr:S8 family serine peptidase [Halosolutus gelatinilyticus]